MDSVWLYKYRGSHYLSIVRPEYLDCGLKKGWTASDDELVGPNVVQMMALVSVVWPTDESICLEYARALDRPRLLLAATLTGTP